MDIHANAHEPQKLALVLADHFAQIDVSVNVHVAVSPGLEADAGGVEKR